MLVWCLRLVSYPRFAGYALKDLPAILTVI